jgi:hypothetical protein
MYLWIHNYAIRKSKELIIQTKPDTQNIPSSNLDKLKIQDLKTQFIGALSEDFLAYDRPIPFRFNYLMGAE